MITENYEMSNEISNNQQLNKIVELLLNTKAENITLVECGSASPIADWILICEGTNFVHIRALADEVRDYFKQEENMLPFHMEGKNESRWVLLDYTDIVINIMLPELREHYQLEDLWSEYPQKQLN